jgi:response regulator RpfG family c-di-GMP phosphodiesterase
MTNTKKPKILIIEDVYQHFQIIRDLLKEDYDVLPTVINLHEFNLFYSDLLAYLKGEKADFLSSCDDISAFIVDYQLKAETETYTGIGFCKQTDNIWNGKIPVLFATILAEENPTNDISRIRDDNQNIKYDYLRKPKGWGNKTKKLDTLVSESVGFRDNMRTKINNLIEQPNNKSDDCDYEID